MRKALYILIIAFLVLILVYQPPVNGYSQSPVVKDSIVITYKDSIEKYGNSINILVDSSIKNTEKIVNNQKKFRIDSAIIEQQKSVIDKQNKFLSTIKKQKLNTNVNRED